MGLPANTPAAGDGDELKRLIEAFIANARAAAHSELMVLSHPEAFDAARDEVGCNADPRLVFAVRRMIIAHELSLAVLMSSPRGEAT